jgi:hypothetical protein
MTWNRYKAPPVWPNEVTSAPVFKDVFHTNLKQNLSLFYFCKFRGPTHWLPPVWSLCQNSVRYVNCVNCVRLFTLVSKCGDNANWFSIPSKCCLAVKWISRRLLETGSILFPHFIENISEAYSHNRHIY